MGKNGVGILVDSHLRESVVEVRRVNDRLMTIKLVVGECTLNVVSAYAPQVGLDEEIKMRFWEGLDDIVCSIPPSERLFIGGDFSGHIGLSAGGYTEVHGGFGFGERNGGGTLLLDFSKAFDLVIANSSFPKQEEHLPPASFLATIEEYIREAPHAGPVSSRRLVKTGKYPGYTLLSYQHSLFSFFLFDHRNKYN
uniref:Craniofacial development protein 2-like n=1 Tax=Nicotiana tabacum TaxID=4097 RepID=A0A1S4B114_TOBAC|nr:PREDICTED: craniofacial development protein 2-like [Nicotiana tabacum]